MKMPELAKMIMESGVGGNLEKHLCVAEVLWDIEGRQVLFPADAEFFETLLQSNYALEGDAPLNLPHSSFILAMPKGFKVNGVSIPSALIHHTKGSERLARYDQATKAMNTLPMGHVESELTGKDSLSFFYQDPSEEEGVFTLENQSLVQVAGALKAESAEEYAEILGDIPRALVSDRSIEPGSEGHVINYVLTKLLGSISVYLSSRAGDQIISGLPNNGNVSIDSYKTDLKYNFSHMVPVKETT